MDGSDTACNPLVPWHDGTRATGNSYHGGDVSMAMGQSQYWPQTSAKRGQAILYATDYDRRRDYWTSSHTSMVHGKRWHFCPATSRRTGSRNIPCDMCEGDSTMPRHYRATAANGMVPSPMSAVLFLIRSAGDVASVSGRRNACSNTSATAEGIRMDAMKG